MSVDDRQREAEHVDSCWAGCDDPPWPLGVVTEYGFEERGLL